MANSLDLSALQLFGSDTPRDSRLARRGRGGVGRPHRSRSRARPRLELLEDRMLLTTFYVYSNSDSNAGFESGGSYYGTFRYALNELDAVGGSSNLITFADLPSSEFTFKPGSPLPAITERVYIEGDSPPLFDGTPLIDIVGGSAGSGANGLTFGSGSSGSLISDLAIGGFSGGDGIDISGGSTGDIVGGCWLGLDASGTANGNSNGVFVSGSGTTIGGTAYYDDNVIAGNSNVGVDIDFALPGRG